MYKYTKLYNNALTLLQKNAKKQDNQQGMCKKNHLYCLVI